MRQAPASDTWRTGAVRSAHFAGPGQVDGALSRWYFPPQGPPIRFSSRYARDRTMSNDDSKPDETKPTFDADINRGAMTITQFMAKHGIEGGVGLDDSGGSSSASELLTKEGARKYEVGGMIAKGGMGVILSAKDLNIRRTVAMKLMLDPKQADEGKVLRFIEEAQVTGQLEHPSIVPVYELGVDADDNVFYTMKFVQGVTLKAILKGIRDGDTATIARYPLGHLLTISLKACDAMAFVHSKGVVHRDLKPENIMVGDFGEVLVMDWGLAKVLAAGRREGEARHSQERSEGDGGAKVLGGAGRDRSDLSDQSDQSDLAGGAGAAISSVRADTGDVQMTMDGQVLGTPAFMAPEQAEGKIDQIDARTDVYALGAVFYNILTLHPPVEGSTKYQILMKVARGEITPPSALNAEDVASERRKSKTKAADVQDLQRRAMTAARKARKGQTEELAAFPHCPGGRIPPALSAVAMKALANKQDDRYQTVKELQADIEAYQGGFATAAEEAGFWTQSVLLVKRHKGVFGAAACALVGLVAVVAGFVARLSIEKNALLAAKIVARHNEQRAEAKAEEARIAKDEIARVSVQAAPEFVAKTDNLMRLNQWEDARTAAGIAVGLAGQLPEAWLARGRVALGRGEFAEAEREFREAIRLASSDRQFRTRCAEYAKLAGEASRIDGGGKSPSVGAKLGLAKRLESLGDAILASWFYAQAGTTSGGVALRMQAALETLKAANPKLQAGRGCYEITAKGVTLNLSEKQVVTIAPLAGLPITRLNLFRTKVSDLSPLKDMPLAWLNLQYTRVSELGPLRGLPLEDLNLHGNRGVSDIGPLEGMRLTVLKLGCTRVNDISVLEGMPLTQLDLPEIAVKDISALSGMALRKLHLFATKVSNVETLRGMPLAWLNLHSTLVTDIDPLQGMKLCYLNLRRTKIRDISVLRGMPLTELHIPYSQVTDVSALAGMPLSSLYLSPGRIVSGMEALRSIRTLAIIATNQKEWREKQTAAAFWRKYDAGRYRK